MSSSCAQYLGGGKQINGIIIKASLETDSAGQLLRTEISVMYDDYLSVIAIKLYFYGWLTNMDILRWTRIIDRSILKEHLNKSANPTYKQKDKTSDIALERIHIQCVFEVSKGAQGAARMIRKYHNVPRGDVSIEYKVWMAIQITFLNESELLCHSFQLNKG